MTELNWSLKHSFKEGLAKTVEWYLSNSEGLENIISGEYLEYYKTHYSEE